MNPNSKLAQRGDTIVEVLIATAVTGLILASSTVVVSRAVNVMRGSQERSEAGQMLQGQVELLREAVLTSVADEYLSTATDKVFCVDPADITEGPVALSGVNNNSLTSLSTDVLASPNPYPAACVSGRYHFSVEKPDGTDGTYTFHARWEGLTGNREETIFYYRVHKAVEITSIPPPACPLGSPVTYTFDPGGPKADFHSNLNRVSGPAGVEPQSLGPMALSLPPGGIPAWDNYTVTLLSYDTHDLFDPDTDQREQWRAVLRDGSGNATYTSPYSTDVPTTLMGGVRQGPPDVFTGQTIGSGTVSLTAQHIGIGSNGFHVESATISCP